VAKDENGMPLRAIGTHTDITAQKRAEEALQESHKRLESFLHISQTMTSTLEREKLMQMLVDNAVRVTGMDSGAIYLINNKETIMLEATTPALPPNFPDEFRIAKTIDHPHIEKTIHTGIYTIVADTKTTELSPAEMEIVNLRNLRSNLYLPIQFRDNPIGILILSSVEVPREFSQEVISLLQGFASQAAQIIENIRNFKRIKEYTTKLEAEIAERKLTEKKLKESENTLRTFVANQPGVAYITDKEGYFLLSEGQGLQQLGLKPGQVVGLSVFDVYKDIPVIGDTIHKAMKGNEYIFTVNVGKNIFESWIGPIKDETGAINGVMGISWDITQRMLAEEQLIKARELAEENEKKTKNLYYELQTTEEEIRATNEELKASSDALSQTLNELELANIVAMENAEMYRSLLQTVPDIIIKTDLQGNITFVNDQAVKVISHIPDEQILGRNIFSFIAEEDKKRATENIRLMMDRHIGMQEYKINLHENLTIDAEINGDVIRNTTR
jgi:PAS domain S-box-containing protein